MQTNTNADTLLTREEAAQEADVDPATISRWKKRGFLMPAVDGHAMRFRRGDVLELVERHQKRCRWGTEVA